MKKETVVIRMAEVVKGLTPSGYKMGDYFTLTVSFKGTVLIATHDTREYYSGKYASKYNANIKHGNVSVEMSLTELNKAYKPIAERNDIRRKHDKAHKRFIKDCKNFDFVKSLAKKELSFVEDNPWTEDERYWCNCYNGCGVYRLAVKDGEIKATLYGGYFESNPNNDVINRDVWKKAIHAVLDEKIGPDYKMVKADGSGTYFYLREDCELIPVKKYIVPAPNGDGNLGVLHENLEIQ